MPSALAHGILPLATCSICMVKSYSTDSVLCVVCTDRYSCRRASSGRMCHSDHRRTAGRLSCQRAGTDTGNRFNHSPMTMASLVAFYQAMNALKIPTLTRFHLCTIAGNIKRHKSWCQGARELRALHSYNSLLTWQRWAGPLPHGRPGACRVQSQLHGSDPKSPLNPN